MLDFPRWKVISIWLVLIAGVIWSIPTFTPASVFEAPSALSFIPEKFRPRVNLGLDLAGGSHILLEADVQDVFQEVFLALFQHGPGFESEEHQKAWLCRVAINKCKDVCKSFFRRRVSSLDEMELSFEDPQESEVMAAVLALPPQYKDVIYLFYYEDYTVPQMADLLHTKESTLYSKLHRARALLKQALGGSYENFD